MGFLFLKSLWSFKLGSTVMAKMAVSVECPFKFFFFFFFFFLKWDMASTWL